MKKALRKGSASDDESVVKEDTDDEHHDSLPHDEDAKRNLFKLGKFHGTSRQRRPSLVDIVQLAKSEKLREQHPKKQFKVTKVETDDYTPVNMENDPEINSRIVFERRQSLLRKQQKDTDDSTFEVVNEKKVNRTEEPTSDKEKTTERVLPMFNKRKIGSLLALVKEAVNNKRIDENEKPENEKKDEDDEPGPMTSFPIRSDSLTSRPRTTRQDSQTSVWSDNIPTITISKTASEECILENQQNDIEESKQHNEKINK